MNFNKNTFKNAQIRVNTKGDESGKKNNSSTNNTPKSGGANDLADETPIARTFPRIGIQDTEIIVEEGSDKDS